MPYTYAFDSGPTFTKGQADFTQTNWNFLNPNEPLASTPDQVWIDGVRQQQVAAGSTLAAGQFYVDTAAQKLVLGSDPTGHEVKVSTMQQAIRLGGDGSSIEGIGVRNYATSQYMMASVVSYATNATFENDEIDGSATNGLGIYRAGNTVRSVTVNESGMTGILGNNADGLVIDKTHVENSNKEKFNFAPSAAGIKVSRLAGLTVTNSDIENNYSTGLWTDEDTRDITIANNTFQNNAKNGIMLELSARALVANNKLFDNGESGNESIFISDTNKATLWNNTVNGPRAAVRMAQDNRTRANQPGVGDKRDGAIDADMTWQTMNTQLYNNVFQNDGATATTLPEGRGNVTNYAIVHGQNYSGATNNQMVSGSDGNVLDRTNTTVPKFDVVWQPAGAAFKAESTWGAYRADVPTMDANSYYRTGTVFNSDGQTVQSAALAAAHGQAIPADVAKLMGVTTGSTVIGAQS